VWAGYTPNDIAANDVAPAPQPNLTLKQ